MSSDDSEFEEPAATVPPGEFTGAGASARLARRIASTETVGFDDDRPPPSFIMAESLDEFLGHLEDACPVITSDPLEAQEVGARYIIGEQLGSGAIGQVIIAQDQHLGRAVAIKILHGGAEVSRDRLARFAAEAQITAQLEHPGIVPVYEVGRMPGGLPYFAMKLVKGESLEDIINNLRVGDPYYGFRYETRRSLRVFRRLCQAVAFAHAKGVVHRDLKPANIMIGEYGEVQIMDWGLARVIGRTDIPGLEPVRTVRDTPDLGTLDGAIAGTPSYMSPEQARGEVDKVGPPSDVYSLGLILAEMLTLVRVHRGNDPGNTLKKVKRSGPVELGELSANAKVDKELEAIVRKCTLPEPAHRYPHAWDLAEDLRKYLDHEELPISPDLSHRKVMKWSRRNPMGAGAFSVLALWALVEIGRLVLAYW